MISPNSITALLAIASLSNARAIGKRSISYTTTCDAAQDPTWNDCQKVFDAMNTRTGDDPNYMWPNPHLSGSSGITTGSGNCAVTVDFYDDNDIPNYYVVDAINDLQSDCQVNSAGGLAYLQPGNNLQMGVSIYSADNNPAKRDNSWEQAYTIDNAAPDQYKQQVLNSQPGGSSWTLTKSQTQTNQVQASESITADLFDLFSSTTSVSYTYTKTVTETSTSTITNNCSNGQSGTLYWIPLFTQYHGGFTSGPSPVDIYIPITESDGSAAGKYEVVCSG